MDFIDRYIDKAREELAPVLSGAGLVAASYGDRILYQLNRIADLLDSDAPQNRYFTFPVVLNAGNSFTVALDGVPTNVEWDLVSVTFGAMDVNGSGRVFRSGTLVHAVTGGAISADGVNVSTHSISGVVFRGGDVATIKATPTGTPITCTLIFRQRLHCSATKTPGPSGIEYKPYLVNGDHPVIERHSNPELVLGPNIVGGN